MSAFSHIAYAAKSDIGRKRKNNEDAFGTFPSIGVFCVADGMGGGDDGEVASAATIRALDTFTKTIPLPPKACYAAADMISGIRASMNGASSWIFERARQKQLKGCGSTFVGIAFDASRPDMATALHAGDSRLYRIRGKSIQQMTKDHSAAELIGAKDESEVNPMFRGMILRAVGIQDTVEIDATPVPVQEGDRILICSDGLSRMVPDRQILAITRDNESPEGAVNALIAAANEAGGVDNVTVVLLKVGALPAALPAIVMPQTARAPEAQTQDADRSTDSTTQNTDGDNSATTGETMTIPEENEPGGQDAPASRPAGTHHKKTIVAVSVILVFSVLGGILFAVHRQRGEAQKTAESQRQAKLLASAEEERKAEERRKDAERKAELEKARKEKEEEAARRQAEESRREKELEERTPQDALLAFQEVCAPSTASLFANKVNGILGKDTVDKIVKPRIWPVMMNSSYSQEEKLQAAVELTKDVQLIVRKLMTHARETLGDAEAELNNPSTTDEVRRESKDVVAKVSEFMRNAEAFVDQDPAKPKAQFMCAQMISSIPRWL